MMTRNTAILVSLVLAGRMTSGCATTTLTSSWKDEGYGGEPLDKVLIIYEIGSG
jgi:hypothetical protein